MGLEAVKLQLGWETLLEMLGLFGELNVGFDISGP